LIPSESSGCHHLTTTGCTMAGDQTFNTWAFRGDPPQSARTTPTWNLCESKVQNMDKWMPGRARETPILLGRRHKFQIMG
jgi:hypothetical protein